jgi:hypothetical protein
MRVLRVQTLDAIGRTPSDPTATRQWMPGVASAPVVGIRLLVGAGEILVGSEALCEIAHHTGRLEPPDGMDRAPAREPIQRGERFAVDQGVGLDDRGEPAPAPDGDADVPAHPATELSLDRRAVFGLQVLSRACSGRSA